jgi:acyl-CoA dehydrogenase
MHEGREVLGIRLTWEKRYITLGPVATILGLAFKLFDPQRLIGDKEECGVTLALIPTSHRGVNIGRRHIPLNTAFMNGPNSGKDVFIPMDWVIGGQGQVGHGWKMLVECLAAGRSISLPSMSMAAGKLCSRATGAYARIRTQFRTPIGKFEGVEEPLARIGGNTYLMDATAQAHDGCARPGREAVGDLGDLQVPHDRAHAPDRQRRHGHPRRQGHHDGAEQHARAAPTRRCRSQSPSRAPTSSRAR